MSYSAVRLLLRWLVNAAGVVVAAWAVPGITYESGWMLALVAVVLSFLNAFVKPLLVFFTLPFVIVTLGLAVWLINAFLLWLAGQMVPGFSVATFFWDALIGALIISGISLILNGLVLGPLRRRSKAFRASARPVPASRAVIDIDTKAL